MDSTQEEAVIRHHPITAGIIGITTVAYSAIVFVVRPAGRTYLEVKVLCSPDKGKS